MEVIDGLLENDLSIAVETAMPNEAVGLILSNREVITLTNVSSTPGNSFSLASQEIIDALEQESDLNKVTLWHSHPSGGIGPSTIDIHNRSPFKHHLVVSVTPEGLVYTWY